MLRTAKFEHSLDNRHSPDLPVGAPKKLHECTKSVDKKLLLSRQIR